MISVFVFLGWSQLFLCIDGARKEQTGTIGARHSETTALRRNAKQALTQVHVSSGNSNAQIDASHVKASQSQEPPGPVHSVSGMTTSVPGHRPRAFVVAGILMVLMVMLFAAILATLQRKVVDEVAAPLHPRFPVAIACDFKTLKADSPGDLRRVEDEVAELVKDLTPPSSPEVALPNPQPQPQAEQESSTASATTTPENCVESEQANLPIATPAKVKFGERLRPVFGEAPLPTPPPLPPRGTRRKRCKSDDTPDEAPKEIEPPLPASDLRNLDDEFAELTQDLFPQIPSSPFASRVPYAGCHQFLARDFEEVKTLRAASQGEMRNHDDEFEDLIQDMLPSDSPNRCSANGELRCFEDEISELADDLHKQEPESQV